MRRFSLFAIACLAFAGCKTRRSLDDSSEVRAMPQNEGTCLTPKGRSTPFFFQGNLGLFEVGVLPAEQRFRTGSIFPGPNRLPGKYQEVTLLSDEVSPKAGLLYVDSSKLTCETPAACSVLLQKHSGSAFTEFFSKGGRPINIQMADSIGELGKIVAQITQKNVEAHIVSTNNMEVGADSIGLKLKLYLKVPNQDGQSTEGQDSWTCK